MLSGTYIALLEAGDSCKFNSRDGRPVAAILIRTDKQKLAEHLTVSCILEARWLSARDYHALPRDDSLSF